MPKKKPKRGPVPKEAIDFLEAKGITPGFSYLDVWGEEHIEAFTVAKVMEKAILADIQVSLASALRQGTPFREWAKNIKPLMDKSGWGAYNKSRSIPHRLNVIYDTNLRSARAVGQWDRIERTKRIRPFLRYALGPATRHRVIHVGWAGTVLPVDDPWWDGHTPQNGYLCSCHLIQESRTVVERRGGPSKQAPPSTNVTWRNPRTGKTEQVPRGIDPGFNFNPGKNRSKGSQQADRNATHDYNEARRALKILRPDYDLPPEKLEPTT